MRRSSACCEGSTSSVREEMRSEMRAVFHFKPVRRFNRLNFENDSAYRREHSLLSASLRLSTFRRLPPSPCLLALISSSLTSCLSLFEAVDGMTSGRHGHSKIPGQAR